jgi:hypothetical protein
LPDALIFRIRVKLLHQKYFAFSEAQISRMFHPVPHPSEGRIAIVTDVGDAMDALGCAGERGPGRTAKPCGPDTPTLVSNLKGSDPAR